MNNVLNTSELIANWYVSLQEEEASALQKNVDKLLLMVKDEFIHGRYAQLNEMFQLQRKKMEAYGNLLDIDSSVNHRRIFSYAVYWGLDRLTEQMNKALVREQEAKKAYEEAERLRRVKYLYPMLELLDQNGELPQGTIARKLDISSHALSNFLRNNRKYGLWEFEKQGKYNYYHLTKRGSDYLRVHQKENIDTSKEGIQEVLQFFLSCWSEELDQKVPDIENIFHKMNRRFGKTQVVFGGAGEKAAVRKVMHKIERRKQRVERRLEERYWGDIEAKDFYFQRRAQRTPVDLSEAEYLIRDIEYVGMEFER